MQRTDQQTGLKIGACAELTTYLLAVGVFLWVYITQFKAPSSVIPPHLSVVASLLLPFILFRALILRFFAPGKIRLSMLMLLSTSPFIALASWYALVIVGLDAWGRVITGSMITVYARQLPHILNSLTISIWLPLAIVLLTAVFVSAAAYRFCANYEWTKLIFADTSRPGAALIAALGILASPLFLYVLLGTNSWHPSEPIALSFVRKNYSGLQSHIAGGSDALDSREMMARQTYIPALNKAHRNVVIIVGDALRSEHMSALGYPRTTTPFLQRRMQEQDHIYSRFMRSACAESSCGLMALAASRPASNIATRPFTLQEVLRRNGYESHFILGGDHTNFYGLQELYGELDSFFDGSHQSRRYINDDQLVLDQIEKLPRASKGYPVMLQFHLMSTHGLGSRSSALERYLPQSNYYGWPGRSPKRPPNPTKQEEGVNYYDNGVLRFDFTADQIISKLKEKGYLDDAIVVITGDHGEMLGETGYFSHQDGLSEAVLDIPFVLLRFGYSSHAISEHPLNGQIDISPTVLHELGIPAPSVWAGLPMQAEWTPREIEIQQGPNFGVYRVSDTGEVIKYRRNVQTGEEFVSLPLTDPNERYNLINEVPSAVINDWRAKSGSAFLNTVLD